MAVRGFCLPPVDQERTSVQEEPIATMREAEIKRQQGIKLAYRRCRQRRKMERKKDNVCKAYKTVVEEVVGLAGCLVVVGAGVFCFAPSINEPVRGSLLFLVGGGFSVEWGRQLLNTYGTVRRSQRKIRAMRANGFLSTTAKPQQG